MVVITLDMLLAVAFVDILEAAFLMVLPTLEFIPQVTYLDRKVVASTAPFNSIVDFQNFEVVVAFIQIIRLRVILTVTTLPKDALKHRRLQTEDLVDKLKVNLQK